MHKNLLAIESSFLCSAVDTVSANGKYDLQSWDGETVGHFVNYLYLHSYDAPKPHPLCPIMGAPNGSGSVTTGTHSPGTISSNSSTQRDHSMDQTDPRPLTPLSELRDQLDDAVNDGLGSGPSPVAAERLYSHLYPQETHDYHDFLLAHAKVYALAQSLEVSVLSKMAYHRLLVILENLHPITPESRVKLNVVELLRYVYAHTQDTGARMRNLVSQFVVLNFAAMQSVAEMVELASGGGQLTVDLMAKVCRRVVAGEEELVNHRETSNRLAEVTEELRVERLKVAALEISNGHMGKTLKALVFDLNTSLQQLKSVILNVSPVGGYRWTALNQIETLRVRNEQAMKDMDAGKKSG